jgi:hypothetical protein
MTLSEMNKEKNCTIRGVLSLSCAQRSISVGFGPIASVGFGLARLWNHEQCFIVFSRISKAFTLLNFIITTGARRDS